MYSNYKILKSVSLIISFLSWTLVLVSGQNEFAPCDSQIYCNGTLLHHVQMARIFKDSKTFVDMKMKKPPNETIESFNKFLAENGLNPDYISTSKWVADNFDPEGSEFENWTPDDWKKNPEYLNRIKDGNFREWGHHLHDLWKLLGRKMSDDVKNRPELYSIIWVPHPVIVPGGRFREFYYWDSYWIIKGLMLSGMEKTARGMLENFLYIVDKYGFVPNGGRIYYLKRSQPPLLIPSVKVYYDFTQNLTFIKENIQTMEKEFQYWLDNHSVYVTMNNQQYRLAVYGDKSQGPRPESYSEDIHSASTFKTLEEKENHYSELKAAAESGWDFSSRWFISPNNDNSGNLIHLATRSIVPVDLNSFIYENAVFLSEFHELLGNHERSKEYKKIAAKWMEAVTAVLWDDDVGCWLDYDLKNKIRRNYFYASNLTPLFNGCYEPSRLDTIVRKIRKYMQSYTITEYLGGIPTSFEETGEQWDMPNAWPPAQHIAIMGLDRTGDEYAQKTAFDLAKAWVRSNYRAFNDTGHMYEKYNVLRPGVGGGGGEYEIQLGFGWSNAVIMDLLNKYGDRLTVLDPWPTNESAGNTEESRPSHTSAASTFGQALAGLLVLLVTIAVGFVGIAFYKRRGQSTIPNIKTKILHKTQYTELRNMPKKGKSPR